MRSVLLGGLVFVVGCLGGAEFTAAEDDGGGFAAAESSDGGRHKISINVGTDPPIDGAPFVGDAEGLADDGGIVALHDATAADVLEHEAAAPPVDAAADVVGPPDTGTGKTCNPSKCPACTSSTETACCTTAQVCGCELLGVGACR
jgi:hypothetical protein